jgi:hypothetical protein
MALADFQQLVDDMVADQASVITPEVRDRAIEQARVRYSADCERELVEDVTWLVDGFDGPLPTGWSLGAYVRQAEYPIGHKPPSLVELAVYQTPTGQSLAAVEPFEAGSVVRVTYVAPHLLQGGLDAADTIPLHHRQAVAQFAAYVLCQQLATRYSAERETAIGADVSQTETRARAYAARAKEYRSAYYIGTGQVDPYAKTAAASSASNSGVTPAAAVGTWPGRKRGLLTRGVL